MARHDKATDEKKGTFEDPGLTLAELCKLWKVNNKTILRMITDLAQKDEIFPGHYMTGIRHKFHGPSVLASMIEGQIPVSRARRRAKK